MKRLSLAVAALFVGMSLSAQLRFGNTPESNPAVNDLINNFKKLQNAFQIINFLYVDSVDSKKLTEDAINGMLSKLDPHSAYTNASDTKKFTEPLEGSFEGIGVQFNMLEDTLLVIQPVPKGPSERVGILAGDRIVSVQDTAIAGVKMSREEIMHRLRGKKGTIAHLGIVRRGIKDTLYFDVKRDKIPVNSVDAAYMVTEAQEARHEGPHHRPPAEQRRLPAGCCRHRQRVPAEGRHDSLYEGTCCAQPGVPQFRRQCLPGG